jgi:hypothetical protein
MEDSPIVRGKGRLERAIGQIIKKDFKLNGLSL